MDDEIVVFFLFDGFALEKYKHFKEKNILVFMVKGTCLLYYSTNWLFILSFIFMIIYLLEVSDFLTLISEKQNVLFYRYNGTKRITQNGFFQLNPL